MPILPSSLLLLMMANTKTSANSQTLPFGISAFVPSCAQTCVLDFIDTFDNAACIASPTLNCLCIASSDTGYTLGEGVVECIQGEQGLLGRCNGADVANDVQAQAYSMCDAIPFAASKTHDTLSATLAVVVGETGIVHIVAPTAATSTSLPAATSSSASRTSTGNTTTSTTQAATSSTLISTSTAIETSKSPAPSAAAQSVTPTTSSKRPSLTEAQIIGIVAGVAGVALILLAILLFACYRRRRALQQDRCSTATFTTFKNDGSSIGSPPSLGRSWISRPIARTPGLSPSGYASRAAPRVPARPPSLGLGYNAFSRRSVGENEIGVAITDQWRDERDKPSPLLPEKPVLRLQVPDGSMGEILGRPLTVFALPGRQTPDTQRDADGYSTATTIVNSSPPARVVGADHPNTPSPSRNAGLYTEGIASDQNPYPRPLNVSRNFSQPSQVPYLRPPPRFTTSSSVYSARPFDRYTTTTQPRTPRQYSTQDPYDPRHISTGSMTSFDSSSSFGEGDIYELPAEDVVALSPVVESPKSAVGVSPVTYPRIHGRLSTGSLARKAPPQPNFQSPSPKPRPGLGSPFAPQFSSPISNSSDTIPFAFAISPASARPLHPSTPSPKLSLSIFPSPPRKSTTTSSPSSTILAKRQLKSTSRTQNSHSPPRTLSVETPTSSPIVKSGNTGTDLEREGRWKVIKTTERQAPRQGNNAEQKIVNAGHAEQGGIEIEIQAHEANGGLLSPTTPTWVTKLTPTRRGDDLFLSVT